MAGLLTAFRYEGSGFTERSAIGMHRVLALHLLRLKN
jgi:hypothetical protein